MLPALPPPKPLFVTGGSGITPVMAMLRMMDLRSHLPDMVLAHSAPDAGAMLFRDELHDLAGPGTGGPSLAIRPADFL